jgi:hypothetical protein
MNHARNIVSLKTEKGNKMRYYLLLVGAVMIVCCRPEEKTERKKERERTAFDVDFQKTVDQFCLLDHRFDTLSLADANTLFFIKSGRWDTSFVLILRRDTLDKGAVSIKGVYQEITPYNTEAGYKTDLAFYTGFSFEDYQPHNGKVVNDSLWNAIINETQSLLKDTVYHKWTLDVDGFRYVLSHDSKFTVNKPSKNGYALEKYAQYLRKVLVYPAYRKKKTFDNSPNPNEGSEDK